MKRNYFILEDVIYMASSYYLGLYTTQEEANKNITPSNDRYSSDSIEKITIKAMKDIKELIDRIHRGAKENKFKFIYTKSRNKFNLEIKSERLKNFNISSFISEEDLMIKTMNCLLKYKF